METFKTSEHNISLAKQKIIELQADKFRLQKKLSTLKEQHDSKDFVSKAVDRISEKITDTDYEKRKRDLETVISRKNNEINYNDRVIRDNVVAQKNLLQRPNVASSIFDWMFKPDVKWTKYDQLSDWVRKISFYEKNWEKTIIVNNEKKWVKTSFIKKWDKFYLTVEGGTQKLVDNNNLYNFFSKLNSIIDGAVSKKTHEIYKKEYHDSVEMRRNLELAENTVNEAEINEAEKMMDDFLA